MYRFVFITSKYFVYQIIPHKYKILYDIQFVCYMYLG
jgi:hypothetical protein